MRQLSPAMYLILVAFTIPLALELRTVAGFVGIDLPVYAVVAFEIGLLVVLTAIYALGRINPDEDTAAQ